MSARKVRRVLIVGCGPLARATIEDLLQRRDVLLLGALAIEGEPVHPSLGISVIGGTHAVLDHLSRQAVDEVYLAADVTTHFAALQHVVTVCERLGTAFAIPTHPFRLGHAVPADRRTKSDGYVHFETDPAHPVQEVLKRAIDIAVAGTALALIAPLLLLVAVLIKLDSKGPVLFGQLRVGQYGRLFRMMKFRSMVVDAEELQRALLAANEQTGPIFKMQRDPRITRVGRVIRRYSIDELPQLWNVLVGHMSLVGPRPPLHKEVEQYQPWQRRRLSVRPGLTCYWQVSGRNAIGFDEWMRLDLQYVSERSLLTDLRLIMQTIPVVLLGRGAS